MIKKILHKEKAIDSYNGAKLVSQEGLVYPTYMLLKESVRATLAYIQEDISDKQYSDKTKLKTLISSTPALLLPNVDINVFNILIDLETSGLEAIMGADISELEKVRKALKQIIGVYLHTRL